MYSTLPDSLPRERVWLRETAVDPGTLVAMSDSPPHHRREVAAECMVRASPVLARSLPLSQHYNATVETIHAPHCHTHNAAMYTQAHLDRRRDLTSKAGSEWSLMSNHHPSSFTHRLHNPWKRHTIL